MKISRLIVGSILAGTLFATLHSGTAITHAFQVPQDAPNDTDVPGPSPRHVNLLTELGGAFVPHQWNQRHQLNSTTYASLLALSIDASKTFGRPIVLNPDFAPQAQVTADRYVQTLNKKNYLELCSNPYHSVFPLPSEEERQLQPFNQISMQRIPNGESTQSAIKAILDNGRAIVFTYNFALEDCSSREAFFRLKFNLADDEVYLDNSSYDTLYDGDHTMCIVGYDDGDATFIVQDSRSVQNQISLPGLTYMGANTYGTIRIPQSLEYTDFLNKLNGLTGTYRHEFFVLVPEWGKTDTKPPKISDLNLCIAEYVDVAEDHDYPNEEYCISVQIMDDVKVADDVSVEISVFGENKVSLRSIFEGNTVTCMIPILAPDSMSAPIVATITMTARDTSGNQIISEFQCNFSSGLPIPIFSELSRLSITSNHVANSLQTEFPVFLFPRIKKYISLDLLPPNLVTSYLGKAFVPHNWEQVVGNCVAYGSLVAASVHASIAKGKSIVLDPDSTLSGGSHVPDYIAMLNKRGYLNDWGGYASSIDTLKNRHAFSNVELQQIGNDDSAKQAIRTAIDNKQPVVFVIRPWVGWGSDSDNLLTRFWRRELESKEFTEINNDGNEWQWHVSGHAMCITGYDDTDGTFIVQNSWGTSTNNPEGRPHGILKIPQNLVYRRWHYHWNWWPATVAGGEYRFQFYKLVPHWITNDTLPPVIGDLSLSLAPSDSLPIKLPPWEYSIKVTDNIKATDAVITIDAPGYKKQVLQCAVYGNSGAGFFAPFGSLVPATVTVAAYDSSGNTSERVFQFVIPTSMLQPL